MEKENLLCDIEKDISGSWEDIQKKVRKKEIKENLKNNVERVNFPSFKVFRSILLEYHINHNSCNSKEEYNLSHIIEGMFYSSGGKFPKSFEKVWEMFCNLYKFKHDSYKCDVCDETWDIFYEKEENIYPNIDYQHITEYTAKIDRSRCPKCGNGLCGVYDGTIIGIFKHFN